MKLDPAMHGTSMGRIDVFKCAQETKAHRVDNRCGERYPRR